MPDDFFASLWDACESVFKVTCAATLCWPGICSSTALSVGEEGSIRKIIASNGGYLPRKGFFSDKPPKWRSVSTLAAGNTALHQVGGVFTSNVYLVSLCAALGSVPGNVGIASDAAGGSGSFFKAVKQIKSPRLFVAGILFEWARELLYNKWCLNGKKNLKQYDLTEEEELLASTVSATGAGAATGLPNAAASRCYVSAMHPSRALLPSLKQVRMLLLSLPVRGATLGLLFSIINWGEYGVRRTRGFFESLESQDENTSDNKLDL